MYVALTTFADLQDKKHLYHEGDKFPREGLFVSKARIEELSTNRNATGKALIFEVNDDLKEQVEARQQATPTEEKDEKAKTTAPKKSTTRRKKKEVE